MLFGRPAKGFIIIFTFYILLQGDSGGPLVVYSATGTATQVGVVSFVHVAGCASGNPSGYVRTESYLRWIHEHTGVSIGY